MPSYEVLQHPVFEVSIGGSATEKRPTAFKLITQMGFHSVISRLSYPADTDMGAPGDKITVSLASGETTSLYFTGEVYSVNVQGPNRELLLTDDFKKLSDTSFVAAYRKEKAATILDDILGAAGITEKEITCPDVELARFSTLSIPSRNCIDLLIDALKGHGVEGIQYFFDEKNVFHFGTKDDTGKIEGEAFSFEKGKDILRTGPGWLEVLPVPVRQSQSVTVNKKALVAVRTDLAVSRNTNRMTLWVREA